jgi:hypothetical protein
MKLRYEMVPTKNETFHNRVWHYTQSSAGTCLFIIIKMVTTSPFTFVRRHRERVGRLQTISKLKYGNENQNHLPLHAVFDIRRPLEYLEPRRSARKT